MKKDRKQKKDGGEDRQEDREETQTQRKTGKHKKEKSIQILKQLRYGREERRGDREEEKGGRAERTQELDGEKNHNLTEQHADIQKEEKTDRMKEIKNDWRKEGTEGRTGRNKY